MGTDYKQAAGLEALVEQMAVYIHQLKRRYSKRSPIVAHLIASPIEELVPFARNIMLPDSALLKGANQWIYLLTDEFRNLAIAAGAIDIPKSVFGQSLSTGVVDHPQDVAACTSWCLYV